MYTYKLMLYCFISLYVYKGGEMTKAMVYKLLEEFNGTLALKDAKSGHFSCNDQTYGRSRELDREYPGFSPYLVNFWWIVYGAKIWTRHYFTYYRVRFVWFNRYDPRQIDLTVPYGYHVSEKDWRNSQLSYTIQKRNGMN